MATTFTTKFPGWILTDSGNWKSLLNMPLVLHGGSGSGDENLRKAVSCGINKVNICTDAFQICKTAFLQTQAQQPDMGLHASLHGC